MLLAQVKPKTLDRSPRAILLMLPGTLAPFPARYLRTLLGRNGAILLGLLSAACIADEHTQAVGQWFEALDESRTRWEATAHYNYRFQIRTTAFEGWPTPWYQVEVRNGEVMSVVPLPDPRRQSTRAESPPLPGADLTIPGLFEFVEVTLREQPWQVLALGFDSAYAYPSHILIDRSRQPESTTVGALNGVVHSLRAFEPL